MPDEHIYIGFYTATILEWKKLLQPDKYKEIIINSLKFLSAEKRTEVYGFVIMTVVRSLPSDFVLKMKDKFTTYQNAEGFLAGAEKK
jgi:hypothetical protein